MISPIRGGIHDRRPLGAAGAIPGTPRYMPPEQQRGIVDARSDQYALCKTFAEAFGDEPMPRGLAEILRRGTRDAPDERDPDLRALLAELEAVARPRRGATLGIVLAGIGAIAAIVASRLVAEPSPGPPIPCEDGRASLESVWGQARQSEIRAAFERSGETSWRRAWNGVPPASTPTSTPGRRRGSTRASA